MIRINLLPHRKRPESADMSETIRPQLLVGIGALLVTVLLCWIWGNALIEERDHLRQVKMTQEQALAAMMAKREKVERLRNSSSQDMASARLQGREWQQKLFPVVALDEISRSINPLDIWLTALSIDQEEVVMTGKAFSRTDIDTFVDSLEQVTIFESLTRMHVQPFLGANTESMHQFTFHFQTHNVIL